MLDVRAGDGLGSLIVAPNAQCVYSCTPSQEEHENAVWRPVASNIAGYQKDLRNQMLSTGLVREVSLFLAGCIETSTPEETQWMLHRCYSPEIVFAVSVGASAGQTFHSAEHVLSTIGKQYVVSVWRMQDEKVVLGHARKFD